MKKRIKPNEGMSIKTFLERNKPVEMIESFKLPNEAMHQAPFKCGNAFFFTWDDIKRHCDYAPTKSCECKLHAVFSAWQAKA